MPTVKKLTKQVVDALPIPAKGQEFHWCSVTPGFAVRVTASGAKSYIVQGRVKGTGKESRYTIGPCNLLGTDEARKRALSRLLEMHDGKNPQAEKKKRQAQGVTLREVMQDYIENKRTKHGPLRPSSKSDIEKCVTKQFGDWADKPVAIPRCIRPRRSSCRAALNPDACLHTSHATCFERRWCGYQNRLTNSRSKFPRSSDAKKNQAWSEGQQVLAVSDAAYKQQQRLAKKFDNVRATLDKQIAHFEETLQQPLESRASVGISGEIRKFVKDMTTEERHKFIQEAIDAGDHTTVSAVLGAPSYLSGLDANFAKTYTRFWHERATPEVATKLKAVRNAKAAIEERGALLFKEVEKAMGSTWSKVQELRQGNDKALAALKFGE